MSVASEGLYQRYEKAAAGHHEFINFNPVHDRVLLIGDEQISGNQETVTLTSSAEHQDERRSKGIRDVHHMSGADPASSFFATGLRHSKTATTFIQHHNPFTIAGRTRLRNYVLRSGPAYQVPESVEGDSTGNKLTGWRVVAVLNICLLVLCLIFEIAMLAAAAAADERSSNSGFDGIIYQGSCTVAKRWMTIVSLFLNIVATTTIGCSNYTMQCLSAPSGSELRLAHQKGRSLQVGVSSPSNIRYLSKGKTILWWTMGLSSIPVHLLFNSAFYSSLQTNNYAMAIVTSDFEDNASWTICSSRNITELQYDSWSRLVCDMKENATDSSWENLTNEECIKRYSEPLVRQYSNVIVISSINSTDRPGRWEMDKPNMTVSTIESPSFGSTLGYTVGCSWQNWTYVPTKSSAVLGSSVPESEFEAPLLDMPALFGVFMSFSYSAWDEGYRYQNDLSTTTYPSYDPTRWLCHDNYTQACTQDAAVKNSTKWVITPDAIPIQGCLSQSTPGEHCQLLYSTTIIIVILGCDLVKILVVVCTLRLKEKPCVTTGDAITSFLDVPDVYTEKRCFVDKELATLESNLHWLLPPDFSPREGEEAVDSIWAQYSGPSSAMWLPRPRRWFHAPSKKRWLVFALWLVPLLVCAGLLLYYGILDLDVFKGSTMWTKGFSTPDPNAIYTRTQSYAAEASFVRQVVLVNLPQLLLSYLYILYNGLLTTMHASQEWTGFATERKTLRVSDPRPGQRSTYWLNLPWKYSLPLLAVSALLHWLVSRSLYLVRVNVIGPTGLGMPRDTIAACGYSILMMLLVIAVLVIMAVVLFGLSMRRLESSRIPIVGTSSIAISAACHHPNDVETEACKPLLWGVTEIPSNGRPGHCALPSGPVSHPEVGKEYW